MKLLWKQVITVGILSGLLLVATGCGSLTGNAPAPTKTPKARPSPSPTATRVPPTPTPTPTLAPPIASGTISLGGAGEPIVLNLDKGTTSNDLAPSAGDIELVKPGALPGAISCVLIVVGQSKLVSLGKVDFKSITIIQLVQQTYNQSFLSCNNDATNELQTGDVFAVKTNGNNLAKVLVVGYTASGGSYRIKLQWATYTPGGS